MFKQTKQFKIFLLVVFVAILSGTFFAYWRIPSVPPEPKVVYNNRIEIYKKAKKLVLYYQGRVFQYAIATGKNPMDKKMVGDLATPLGRFKIVSIEKSDQWTYDFGDGRGPIKGAYGPWFLRFDGQWVGIAIHGTHDESTIGKDDSHGCIRMRNREVDQVKSLVSVGWPVEVFE